MGIEWADDATAPSRRSAARTPNPPGINSLHGATTTVAAHAFVDDYLPYLLAQASSRVSREFHRKVEAAGLSVTEWRVMASLSGNPPLSIRDLSHLALTKQPTLSKVVQRMEREGLLQRCDNTNDGRETLVRLSPMGQQQVASFLHEAKEHQSRVLRPLGTRNARVLVRVLRQLLDLPDAGR